MTREELKKLVVEAHYKLDETIRGKMQCIASHVSDCIYKAANLGRSELRFEFLDLANGYGPKIERNDYDVLEFAIDESLRNLALESKLDYKRISTPSGYFTYTFDWS